MFRSQNISKFPEKTLKRRQIYKGRAVNFWVDTVKLSSGLTATREYLGHPGAVAIIPLLESHDRNPKVLMVRQYRYPVKEITLELPAGKLGKGEAPISCAHRELEEETGYKARSFKKLISYWPTPAFANEVIHIYIGYHLKPGHFDPDEDEVIEPVIMSLNDALRKIFSGRIKDSKTIIGFLALQASLKVKPLRNRF